MYRSAAEMHEDWYGYGFSKFSPGGIIKKELESGPAWRKSYTCAEKKQFSRLKFVVGRIDAHKQRHIDAGNTAEWALQQSLNHFNNLMRAVKGCSTLSGLERHLSKVLRDETQNDDCKEH